MTPLQLFVDGKPLRVGRRIGGGGEGEVYLRMDDPSQAIKIYTDKIDREDKISTMVRLDLAQSSPLIAFPMSIARDSRGRFKGFAMKLVKDHQPIFELYSPSARKQQFPEADYRFLVRAALNTARAIAAVHETGCVIGDINHSGILISKQATAALIDADSFQIIDGATQYLCRVGVPEYTPPELQNASSLSTVTRTPNHDAFGLAIVIFQLLAMGRHPFVGVYAGSGDMPIPKAISEFRFAYSQANRVGMVPPPGACTLSSFTPEVSLAFETAFGRSQVRPTAKQWVALLDEFERSLVKCRANPLHYFCARTPSCPWCKMEQTLGMVLFVPSFSDATEHSESFGTEFNLALIWARVQSVKLPIRSQISPLLPQLNLNPSPEAITANGRDIRALAFYCATALFGFVAIATAEPLFFVIAAIAVYLGYQRKNPKNEFIAAKKPALAEIDRRWNDALNDWERHCGFQKAEELRLSIQEAKSAYEAIKPEEARRIADYQKQRRSIQLKAHLDKFRIRDHKIRGIGPAKLATLASYGIETAAHVTRSRILDIQGFGPTNSLPLFKWQQECANRFRYNPAPTPADSVEIGKIKADIRRKTGELEQRLKRDANSFVQVAHRCKKFLSTPDPLLSLLNEKRSQIEVDFAYLNVTVPLRPRRPVSSQPISGRTGRPMPARGNTTVFPRPAMPHSGRAPVCPNCGSAMRRRIARRGHRAGKPFWGCSRYPLCRGTRPI